MMIGHDSWAGRPDSAWLGGAKTVSANCILGHAKLIWGFRSATDSKFEEFGKIYYDILEFHLETPLLEPDNSHRKCKNIGIIFDDIEKICSY
jgi:hypothetical protein